MNQHCVRVCVCIEISAAVIMAENTPSPFPWDPCCVCACVRAINLHPARE